MGWFLEVPRSDIDILQNKKLWKGITAELFYQLKKLISKTRITNTTAIVSLIATAKL